MIILRDSSDLPSSCKGSVLALGNFDGLHLGHLAILKQAVSLAKKAGKPVGVLTFEPHPRRVFKPELPPLRIFPFHEKVRRLAALGVDFIRVVRFTRAFSQTSAEQFITQLLHEQMQVSHVVTGEDFIFGHNRTGNAHYLSKRASELGIKSTACSAVSQGGQRCSSTQLRSLLTEGNVASIATLLTRPYSITGRVREGDKRGALLGFPTANIVPARIFLPARGVYAVKTRIEENYIDGVANLGHRPTFGGTEERLETYLFDWQGNLYGKRLEIEFAGRIRDEQKFDGLEALKQQIAQDCTKAREILKASK